MKLTDEHISIMRANRDFLAELICATQTPNIPTSIRQHAQEILSQYPVLPLAEEFSASAYCAASKLEHAATSSRSVKEKT